MSFSDLTTDPPKGFRVTRSGDGDPVITYRDWWVDIVFTFRPDRLVVERRPAFGSVRRSEFSKQAIRVVRQVLNAVDWRGWGDGDADWDLVIEIEGGGAGPRHVAATPAP